MKNGAEVESVRFLGGSFVLADVIGLRRRPLDNATAQLDLLFVPKEAAPRTDRRWAAPRKAFPRGRARPLRLRPGLRDHCGDGGQLDRPWCAALAKNARGCNITHHCLAGADARTAACCQGGPVGATAWHPPFRRVDGIMSYSGHKASLRLDMRWVRR